MSYALTRPGGGYLSLYGWRQDKGAALQFRSKAEALDHASTNGMTGALAEYLPPAAAPGMDSGFNPFSTKAPARG